MAVVHECLVDTVVCLCVPLVRRPSLLDKALLSPPPLANRGRCDLAFVSANTNRASPSYHKDQNFRFSPLPPPKWPHPATALSGCGVSQYLARSPIMQVCCILFLCRIGRKHVRVAWLGSTTSMHFYAPHTLASVEPTPQSLGDSKRSNTCAVQRPVRARRSDPSERRTTLGFS